MRFLFAPFAFAVVSLTQPLLAAAQDSDRDGVADTNDRYPCDAAFSSAVFVPAENTRGVALFGDSWPEKNQLALGYYVEARVSAGQTARMTLVLNPVVSDKAPKEALGFRLPNDVNSATAVMISVGGQTARPAAVTVVDRVPVVILADEVAGLFADPNGSGVRSGARIEVTVTGASFDPASIPFDLYLTKSKAKLKEKSPGHPTPIALTLALADVALGTTLPAVPVTVVDQACTASWRAGEWSACSASCGSGVRTRSLTCAEASGAIVADNRCSSVRPAASEVCSVGPCPTYHWFVGNWGSCSASCGTGSTTRSVSCRSDSGATVADVYCGATIKPATTESCEADAGCVTYGWVAGTWSSCSASCGTGTMTRSVTCASSTGVAVSDAFCGATARPTSSNSCDAGQACTTHGWVVGNWGTCSASCGTGTISRAVTCQDTTGAVVADVFCGATTKPSTLDSCEGQGGCTTFAWFVGDWGSCSASCGTGSMSRAVTCRSSTGATVSDASCAASAKPATFESCEADWGCVTYAWAASDWSTCSATCGVGTQTRSVWCTSSAGAIVADRSCTGEARPGTSQTCNAGPCGTP